MLIIFDFTHSARGAILHRNVYTTINDKKGYLLRFASDYFHNRKIILTFAQFMRIMGAHEENENFLTL